MGLCLQIEIESPLGPAEFHERIIVPVRAAVEREGVGRLIEDDSDDDDRQPGKYELALEVSDQQRAREVIDAALEAIED